MRIYIIYFRLLWSTSGCW